jgi:hypothetical protein
MKNLEVRQHANSTIYETDDAIISLVKLSNGSFELLCKYGNLFQDELRFSSLEDAENRVYQLLSN